MVVQEAVLLVTGEAGVADEPQMCLRAEVGESLGEPHDSRGEAARARVCVGPFEGKEMKLHAAAPAESAPVLGVDGWRKTFADGNHASPTVAGYSGSLSSSSRSPTE